MAKYALFTRHAGFTLADPGKYTTVYSPKWDGLELANPPNVGDIILKDKVSYRITEIHHDLRKGQGYDNLVVEEVWNG